MIAKREDAMRWYAVGLLTVAYTFSYIDRQILSLMVGPIRADLGISDTQFSLLQGLAFAVLYTALGVPIAWLADRGNRRNLIAVGISVWSLATALCGLTRTFPTLFLARVGVGVGEAALSPAAYSMLTDMFPRERLGRAFGVYASGVFIGIGLSFILGAELLAFFELRGGLLLPVLGTLRPWQAVFLSIGLPGLLLSLLVMTLREPARPSRHRDLGRASFAMALQYFGSHWKVFVFHFSGFAMMTLLFNAIMSWAPEYLIRIHNVPRAEAGRALGIIAVIFGGSGIIAGGLLSDFLTRRGYRDAPLRASLAGAVVLLPVAALTPLVSYPLTLLMFCPLLFFASFPFGPAALAIQLISPPNMRAQLSALYLFVVNLTGIGFGGTAVALFTDFVYQSDDRLHHAMATVGALGGSLSLCALLLCLRGFAGLVERQERADAMPLPRRDAQ
ncbi:spinster family MFS transporter [Pseudohaliea rubra]|uniref:Permease of the major facilitator superfamily n=1 Tax=Pseudohaliea rubra DSM 19751 TaxID=1265313 RepID=A0A095VTW6_9GAMM|nr:MFS transporter [Pseudohaliea rubra]KGE04513.1 Permease of the major facilitator superfamily [Pseudohaliea rubra DSM 19751]